MAPRLFNNFLALLISALLLILTGCSGNANQVGNAGQVGSGSIAAQLQWGDKTAAKTVASLPTGVAKVRLSISGTGITTVSQDFDALAGSGTLTSVPAGSGYTFTASALDGVGKTLYTGVVSNVVVTAGQTTTLLVILAQVSGVTPIGDLNGLFTNTYKGIFKGVVSPGTNGTIVSSTDGYLWTQRQSSTNQTLRNVAFMNTSTATGLATTSVAVGYGGSIMSSNDYINWTSKTSGVTANLDGVIYETTSGKTGFYAVGYNGTILKSADGITWAAQASGTTSNMHRLARNGLGTIVTVGDGGTIVSTTDGSTWVTRTSGTTNNLMRIQYWNNYFFALGDNGSIIRSADGVTWTKLTLPTDTVTATSQMRNMVYAAPLGLYVVGGANGVILTSPDATTWTKVTSNSTAFLYSMAYYSNGTTGILFAAAGDGTILKSTDAVNWSPVNTGATTLYHGISVFIGNTTRLFACGTNGQLYTASNPLTATSWAQVTIADGTSSGTPAPVVGSSIQTILTPGAYTIKSTYSVSKNYYGIEKFALATNGKNLTDDIVSYFDTASTRMWVNSMPPDFPSLVATEYHLTSSGWAQITDVPQDGSITSFNNDGTATMTSAITGDTSIASVSAVDISGKTVSSSGLYGLPLNLPAGTFFPTGSLRFDFTYNKQQDSYSLYTTYNNTLGTNLAAIPGMFPVGGSATVYIDTTVGSFYAQFVGGTSTVVNIYSNNSSPAALIGTGSYAITTVKGVSILDITIPSTLRTQYGLAYNPIFALGPTGVIMLGNHAPIGVYDGYYTYYNDIAINFIKSRVNISSPNL